MRFSKALIRFTSWLAVFNESDIGSDAKSGEIGVVVPGLLKEDGSRNNKGNVLAVIKPDEAADLMAELRLDQRDQTPAEVVRRTRTVEDGIVSFKVSNSPGSRTIKVAEDDWSDFLDTLEAKLEQATVNLQTIAEMNVAALAEAAGEPGEQ